MTQFFRAKDVRAAAAAALGMDGDRLSGNFLALEPRMVFDGAGVAVATDAAKQASDNASSHSDASVHLDESSAADKAAELAKALSEAASPPSPPVTPHEIVFIDSRVPDIDTLRKTLPSGAEVILVSATEDGIAKITETLKSEHDVTAIHIISHGTDGAFELGKGWIGVDALKAHEADIASWKTALLSGADILLYGCDIAKATSGEAFIKTFAQESGVDIAASADAVGMTAHGADWSLEKSTGKIETKTLYADSYQHALDTTAEIQATYIKDDQAPALAPNSTGAALYRSTTYDVKQNWTNDVTPTFSGTGAIKGAIIRVYVIDDNTGARTLVGSSVVTASNGTYSVTVGQYAAVDKSNPNLTLVSALTPPSDYKVHIVTTQQDITKNLAESLGADGSTFYINLTVTPPEAMSAENLLTYSNGTPVTGTIETSEAGFFVNVSFTEAQQQTLAAAGGFLYAYRVDASGKLITSSRYFLSLAANATGARFNPLLTGFYTNTATTGVEATETYYLYLADRAGNYIDGNGKVATTEAPTTKSALALTIHFQQLAKPTIDNLLDDVGNPKTVLTGGVTDDVTPTLTGTGYISGTTFRYQLRYTPISGVTSLIANNVTLVPTDLGNGNWSVVLPDITGYSLKNLGDGVFQVALKAVSSTSNSDFAIFNFALDRTIPTFHLEDASGQVQTSLLADGALVDGVSLIGDSTKAVGSTITIEVTQSNAVLTRDSQGGIVTTWTAATKTTFTTVVGASGKWTFAIPSSVIGTGLKSISAKVTDANGATSEMSNPIRIFLTSASTPGGIGQDGLSLWYDPTMSGSLKDGNGNVITPSNTPMSVASLTDLSGNKLDATQLNAALRPVVMTDSLGRTFLRFTAAFTQSTSSIDWTKTTYFSLPAIVNSASFIYTGQLAQMVSDANIVAIARNPNFNTPFFYETDGGGGANGFYVNANAGYGYSYPMTTVGSSYQVGFSTLGTNGQAIGSDQPWIIGTAVAPQSKGNSAYTFTIDGKTYTASGFFMSSNAASIGSIGGGFSGQIGSIIGYSRALTSAETAILTNVEAQEYAQALASGATDYFIVKGRAGLGSADLAALQLTFSHDVAGILNDGTSSETSVANGGLIISDSVTNPFLTTNSGIFFGNDGAESDFAPTNDPVNPGVTRLTRTWAIDVTNGNANGQVDLSFDVMAAFAQSGKTFDQVKEKFDGRKGMNLAWRANDGDPWQIISTSDTDVILSGGKVTFSGLKVGAGGLQDGFITLMDGPTVQSITPNNSGTLSSPTISFTVMFSEAVSNLSTDCFTLTDKSGATRTAAIVEVDGDGSSISKNGQQTVSTKLGTDGKYYVTVVAKAWVGSDKATLNYNFLTPTGGVDVGTKNAGNVMVKTAYSSTPADFTYTVTGAIIDSYVDDVGPKQSTTMESGSVTDDVTPTLSGSVIASATSSNLTDVFIFVDGTNYGSAKITSGKWSYTSANKVLTDGKHQFTVKAADQYGNLSTESINFDINVDTTAPTITRVERATPSAQTTNSDSLTFRVTFTDAFSNLTASNFIATGSNGALTVSSATKLAGGDGTVWLVNLAGSDIQNYNGPVSLGLATTGLPTDAAGNSLATTMPTGANYQTYILNNGAPTVSIDKAVDNFNIAKTITSTSTDRSTDDQTPTLQGTVASGSTVDVFSVVTGVETKLGAATVSSTTWSFTPTTPLAYGSYTFRVKATDALTNVGTSSDFSLTLSNGPAAPTINSYIDDVAGITGTAQTLSLTNDAQPILNLTAEGASSVEIFDGTTSLGKAVQGQGNSWSFAVPTALSNGLHNLIAKSTDANGNTTTGQTFSLTVDTYAEVMNVERMSPVAQTTNADSLTFRVTFTDAFPNLTDENFIAIGSNGPLTVSSAAKLADSDGTVWLVTLAGSDIKDYNGSVSLGISAAGLPTDAAGNVLTTTISAGPKNQYYILNNGVPTVSIDKAVDNFNVAKTITSTSTDRSTDDQTPTLQGTVASGSTVDMFSVVNGVETKLGAATVSGTTWSFTPTTPLAYGSYTFRVKATDALTNVGTSSDFSLTLSNGPAAPSIDSYIDDVAGITGTAQTVSLTNDAQPVLSITAQGATSVEIFDGTTSLGKAVQVQGNSWSFAVPTALSNGLHNMTARSTDANGNTTTGANFALTIDAKSPVNPSLSLANDTGQSASDLISNNGTLSVSNIESGATWDYSIDGGKSWNSGTGTSFTLKDGVYVAGTIQIRQTDQAGNTSSITSLGDVTIDILNPAAPRARLAVDTGASDSDGITSNGLVHLGNLEPGSIWEYSLNGGTSWSVGMGTSFVLPEGDYADGMIKLRQTDIAGNLSDIGSLAGAISVITELPVQPSIALHEDTGPVSYDGVTHNNRIDVSNLQPGAVWEYSVDGGSTWTAGTGTSFTLKDGVYAAGNVQTRQTDRAGNISASGLLRDVTIDTVAPSVSITINQSNLEAGQSALVTLVASDPLVGLDLTMFSVTGGKLGKISHDQNNPLRYSMEFISDSSFDGTAQVQLAGPFTDTAGNIGKTAVANVTLNVPRIAVPADVIIVNEPEARAPVTVAPVRIDPISNVMTSNFGQPLLTITNLGPRQSTLTTSDGRVISADIVGSTSDVDSKLPTLEFSSFVRSNFVEVNILVRMGNSGFRVAATDSSLISSFRIIDNGNQNAWVQQTNDGKILIRRDGPQNVQLDIEIEHKDGSVIRKRIIVDTTSGQFELGTSDDAGLLPESLDEQLAQILWGDVMDIRRILSELAA